MRRRSLPCRIEEGDRLACIVALPQCLPDSGREPKRVVAPAEHLATTWPVDPDRVYLTGFSMGAFGVWRTGCYDPDRFAALAPIVGDRDTEQVERVVKIPIWSFHGTDDQIVPFHASEEIVEAVRKCGGQIELTACPGLGHCIGESPYQNPQLWAWLLAQRRGETPPISPPITSR